MNAFQDTYQTIKVTERGKMIGLQIYRPEASNSINAMLVKEIISVIEQAETNPEIKVIVLSGMNDHFCTGMDFNAVNEESSGDIMSDDPDGYYNILKLFSTCSKIIISKVEGKVNAGGIGFVAASDIVIAGEQATFGLSEALFGLLPACVMPFLIRRVGYQKAQWMTLITQGITAQKSYEIGLVDEVSSNVDDAIRKNLLRLGRLDPATVKDLKTYMNKLWIIDESTQRLAVGKISSLVRSEKIQTNIKNFIEKGIFPWEK